MNEKTEGQKSIISVNLAEEEPKSRRKLSGPIGLVARILAIGLPVYSFIYLMNFFPSAGLFVYSGTHNGIFLAVVLTLLFLIVPASRSAPKTRVPWYDFIFIVFSLAGILYFAANYEQIIKTSGVGITSMEQILGFLTMFALFEAVRRTVGWAMIIVVLFFLIHAKFTYLFPGILETRVCVGSGINLPLPF